MPNLPSENRTPVRVLAVASHGGHWVQMQRLTAAFDSCEVHYATTADDVARTVAPIPVHTYPDANKSTPFRMLGAMLRLAWIVLRVRPQVIVSTGAAGGALAIAIGRLTGARGLFIDSVANAERLSLSARIVRRYAHVLSQWPQVAAREGVAHRGSVL